MRPGITFNREQAMRVLLLALVVGCVLAATGCSVNWVTEVSGMVPALGAAAAAFLGLLTAFGTKVPSAAMQTITAWEGELQKDLGTLTGLINDYNAAEGDGKQPVLAEIEGVANDIVSKFTTILPALHVDNPATQAKVTAVAQAILVQMQAIAAIIPVVEGTAKVQEVANAGRLPMNAQQFAVHFNQIVAHATGDAETDGAVQPAHMIPMPQTKA